MVTLLSSVQVLQSHTINNTPYTALSYLLYCNAQICSHIWNQTEHVDRLSRCSIKLGGGELDACKAHGPCSKWHPFAACAVQNGVSWLA